jgi:AcrR family transcriptional regulator
MKKSDRTKQRLLEAATAEFAAYGFAGARVDRIAQAADANKQAIYAYFESKERQFEAVYNEMVTRLIAAVQMDAGDLPGYAARLADYYAEHPEVLRIASWYELEKAGQSPRPAASERATQNKIAGIAAAQKAGAITDRFRPEHLLELILGMTRSSLQESASPAKARASRKALIEAVERLVRR